MEKVINIHRRFFAAVIVGALVLSSICLGYSGGSGTAEDPYRIATKADLLELAGTTTDYNKCFIQTADINMVGQVFTTAIIAKDTSSSSGFQGTDFTGIFDGNSYKITNFTINGGSGDFLGLFGRINSGLVKNLGIEYCTVSGSSDSQYIGGMMGFNDSSSNICNCYSKVSVGGYDIVGGLVGYNDGSIIDCYSTGSVSGYRFVGGVVGYTDGGSIINCYSTGTISGTSYAGGLVGYSNGGIVFSSYFLFGAGPDNGLGEPLTDEQMRQQGNFIGWDFLGESANGTCNYWQMPQGSYPVLSIFYGYIPLELFGSGTEEDPYIIADANDLGTIWYRPAAYYVLANDIDLMGIQWSIAVAPVFIGVLDGKGFSINNLVISGVDFLGLFGTVYLNSQIKNLGLENSTVNGTGNYVGVLAGNNCGNISSCYSTGMVRGDRGVGGMVGGNYNGNIYNCYSTNDVNGTYIIGGLVGNNIGGTIISCSVSGTISAIEGAAGGLVGGCIEGSLISSCWTEGNVSIVEATLGSGSAGGLVGYCRDTEISNCFSFSDVSSEETAGGLVGTIVQNSSISMCYAIGNVSGMLLMAGGLVGYNNSGTILNSYASGVVSGWNAGGLVGVHEYGSMLHCYATGRVSGNEYVGGLVGYHHNSFYTKCFWDSDINPDMNGIGNTTDTNVIGTTTAEMQTRGTFTNAGWDFVGEVINGPNDVWDICEGTNYPKLSWQIPLAGDFVCPDGVEMHDLAVLCEEWLCEELSADVWPEGGDGIANFFDWAVFANQWQITDGFEAIIDFAEQWLKTGARYYIADIAPAGDGDGIVNMLDFAVIANNWLEGD